MTATTSLADALAAFQAKLPPVVKTESATVKTKDGRSYSYSYAGLGQISAIVLPLLGAAGLSFSARPTLNAEGKFVLAYRLLHTSGEETAGEYPLPQSASAQEHGSAITYARRYALCSVVGVAPDEDDDGAAASNARTDVGARREEEWDPITQDTLVTGWLAEIESTKSMAQWEALGPQIKAALNSRDPLARLSPTSYHRIAQAASKRRVELQQEAGAS
jgi:hypothetical protein